jgi:hypothetical protein
MKSYSAPGRRSITNFGSSCRYSTHLHLEACCPVANPGYVWRRASLHRPLKNILDRPIGAALFHERRANAKTSPIAQGCKADGNDACRFNLVHRDICSLPFIVSRYSSRKGSDSPCSYAFSNCEYVQGPCTQSLYRFVIWLLCDLRALKWTQTFLSLRPLGATALRFDNTFAIRGGALGSGVMAVLCRLFAVSFSLS